MLAILDGDHSDYVEDLDRLLAPLEQDRADLVMGDRTQLAERGALMPQQVFGNHLATGLIRMATGHQYRDMGPFRVIRWESLCQLKMEDPDFGWNVEMQMKAALQGLRVAEVPVRYRPRLGQSKISGTVSGSFRAGVKILRATRRYWP